jgi:hypothetical protein
MKLDNAIKKLTKNGFTVKVDVCTLEASKGNQIVGCRVDRNGSASAFYTKDADQHSDGQRDYFVETWHGNISRAIQFVDRYAN